MSGEDGSSPASPRRTYRSSFSPVADAAGSGETGGGGVLHGGRGGARRGGSQNLFEAKKIVREVRIVLSYVLLESEYCCVQKLEYERGNYLLVTTIFPLHSLRPIGIKPFIERK